MSLVDKIKEIKQKMNVASRQGYYRAGYEVTLQMLERAAEHWRGNPEERNHYTEELQHRVTKIITTARQYNILERVAFAYGYYSFKQKNPEQEKPADLN